MDEIFDVAVVGYGPTGLVAASLLGQLGHRVVVCERWAALYGLPRLTHIDDETARAVQPATAPSTPDSARSSARSWLGGHSYYALIAAVILLAGYITRRVLRHRRRADDRDDGVR